MRLESGNFMKRTFDIANRHLPQIEVWALNWTAYEAEQNLRDQMRVKFNQPTRWTVNAFMVWRATKARRFAEIREKDGQAGQHYLKVQELGGQRPQTAMERSVSFRVAVTTHVQSVVATSSARLDSHGNWSIGERNQAMSAIGAQRDVGVTSNASAASRAAGRRRGRADYFVPAHGGLKPGIWRRTGPGNIAMVAALSPKAPVYRPRLDFKADVEAVFRDRMPGNVRRAFARALKTAW